MFMLIVFGSSTYPTHLMLSKCLALARRAVRSHSNKLANSVRRNSSHDSQLFQVDVLLILSVALYSDIAVIRARQSRNTSLTFQGSRETPPSRVDGIEVESITASYGIHCNVVQRNDYPGITVAQTSAFARVDGALH